MDGTSQVGTYFYTAPEIEQRWPQINEKVRIPCQLCSKWCLFFKKFNHLDSLTKKEQIF